MSTLQQQRNLNPGSGQGFNNSPFPIFHPRQVYTDQVPTPSLTAQNGQQFSHPPPSTFVTPTPFVPNNLRVGTQGVQHMNIYAQPTFMHAQQSAANMHGTFDLQQIPQMMTRSVDPNQIPEFNHAPAYYRNQTPAYPMSVNPIMQTNMMRPVVMQNVNPPGKFVLLPQQTQYIIRPPMSLFQQNQPNIQHFTSANPPPMELSLANQFQQQQQQQITYEMRSDSSTPLGNQYQKSTFNEYAAQMPSPHSDAQSIPEQYPEPYSQTSKCVFYEPNAQGGGLKNTAMTKQPRKGIAIIDPKTKEAIKLMDDGNDKEMPESFNANIKTAFLNQVRDKILKPNVSMELEETMPIVEMTTEEVHISQENGFGKDVIVEATDSTPFVHHVTSNIDCAVNNSTEVVDKAANSVKDVSQLDKQSRLVKTSNLVATSLPFEMKKQKVDALASGEAVVFGKNNVPTDGSENLGEKKMVDNVLASTRLQQQVTPLSSNASSNDELLEKDQFIQVSKSKSKSKKNKKKKNHGSDADSSRRSSLNVTTETTVKPIVKEVIDEPPASSLPNDPVEETEDVGTRVDPKTDSDDSSQVLNSKGVSSQGSFDDASLDQSSVVTSANLIDDPLDVANSNNNIAKDENANGALKTSATVPFLAGEADLQLKTTSRKSSLQEMNGNNYYQDQMNQSGIKLYSRETLLQIRDNVSAEANNSLLVNIPSDVLRTEDNSSYFSSLPRQLQNSNHAADFFTPKYAMPTNNWMPAKRPSQKRMSDIMPHMGGQMGGQFGQRIISLSLQQDVQLHKVDNAWKASLKTNDKNEITESEVEAKLYKITRSILNKLTPQNFDTLVDQIKNLPIDTEDKLKKCIAIVFEKAISEPSYCVAYARMAQSIKTLQVASKEDPKETVSFRKLLLNSCQGEFERDKQMELDIEKRKKEIDLTKQEEKKKTLILEMEEVTTKARRRSLGNIRFIGELFRIKMLTDKIMSECIMRLLKSDDDDSIECLCGLVRTIGKDLDTSTNANFINNFFQQLKRKSKDANSPNRIRFMLQDVIELRENNWVPRRVDNNPKTIEQIHKEARLEDIQKQQLINTPLPPKMQHAQRPGGRMSLEKQHHEEDWTTMSASNTLRGSYEKVPMDLSRMRITKQPLVDEVKLGPSLRNNWSSGASGGRSSQEADKNSNTTSSNRFQMLSDDSNRGGKDMYNNKWNKGPLLHGSRGFGTSSRNESPSSSSSRGVSRESSLTRVDRPPRSTPPIPSELIKTSNTAHTSRPKQQLSLEDLERKSKSIFDEYFIIKDIKEVFLSFDELHLNEVNAGHFVNNIVCHVMEAGTQKHLAAGDLLYQLVDSNRIDRLAFIKGLTEALNTAVELEIDIPRIWEVMGDIFANFVLLKSNHLCIIVDACKPLIAANKTGPVLSSMFDRIIKKHGKSAAIKLWEETGLSWSDITEESLLPFASKYHLESMNPFMLDMKQQLTMDEKSFEKITKWIDKQVENVEKSSSFVRSLTTAICSSAIQETKGVYKVMSETLLSQQSLFKHYLSHTPYEELQALLAIQHLVHSIDHPYGVLYDFFKIIYTAEWVSEDAFLEWERCDDPAEQGGKGTALATTKQFFEWIRESVLEEETQ